MESDYPLPYSSPSSHPHELPHPRPRSETIGALTLPHTLPSATALDLDSHKSTLNAPTSAPPPVDVRSPPASGMFESPLDGAASSAFASGYRASFPVAAPGRGGMASFAPASKHASAPEIPSGIPQGTYGTVPDQDCFSDGGPFVPASSANLTPESPLSADLASMCRLDALRSAYQRPSQHTDYSHYQKGLAFPPSSPLQSTFMNEEAPSYLPHFSTESDGTQDPGPGPGPSAARPDGTLESPIPNAHSANLGRSGPFQGPPPSRSLWIGSLPSRMTNAALHTLFRRWGPLEGTRVLSLKNCAFVNYVSLADAIKARDQIGGTKWGFWDRLVGLGLGLDSPDQKDELCASENIKIAYARATLAMATAGAIDVDEGNGFPRGAGSRRALPSMSTAVGNAYSAAARERNWAQGLASASNSIVPYSDKGGVALPPYLVTTSSLEEQRSIVARLGPIRTQSGSPSSETLRMAARELPADLAYDPDRSRRFSPVLPPPPSASRRFDPVHLRELRRGVERTMSTFSSSDHAHPSRSPQELVVDSILSDQDVDQYADALMNDLPLLSTDYNGNVVVQRLLERASESTKLAMLRVLSPQLARIGCHKNGTWVAQKVLECIRFPCPEDPGGVCEQQLALAINALAPYIPPLLLDQYGNYVAQGLLRFGSPYTDPIFGAFLEQTWEIAQGRFGARAMRTILDHPNVTGRQHHLAGLAIVLCAIPLACSSNGSILIHWLLDDTVHAFGNGQRFALVWEHLRPALADLAMHKLGSAVLLRIGCQTAEPEVARDLIQTLFETPPRSSSWFPEAKAEETMDQEALPSPDDEAQQMVYKHVLLDQVHGSQLISQLLLSPALSPDERERFTSVARSAVSYHGLAHVPAHRRLTEAVGLVPASVKMMGPPATSGTK